MADEIIEPGIDLQFHYPRGVLLKRRSSHSMAGQHLSELATALRSTQVIPHDQTPGRRMLSLVLDV